MSQNAVVTSYSLDNLAHECQKETERFYKSGSSDDRFCFELFRRAIVDRLQQAWELIFSQYTPLVTGWVTRHPAFHQSAEEREYFVNRAFERMWHAMSPEKFSRMANLKALISYLKLCVHAAVIEHVERRTNKAEWSETDMENDVNTYSSGDTASSAVESAMTATTIWELISQVAKDDSDLVLARCSFVYDMKPAEVVDHYPELFADVKQVYRQKENLLARLNRHAGLQAILAGHA